MSSRGYSGPLAYMTLLPNRISIVLAVLRSLPMCPTLTHRQTHSRTLCATSVAIDLIYALRAGDTAYTSYTVSQKICPPLAVFGITLSKINRFK